MSYVVIQGRDRRELSLRVNLLLTQGYIPCGGIHALPLANVAFYSQAMVSAEALLPAIRKLNELLPSVPVKVKTRCSTSKRRER